MTMKKIAAFIFLNCILPFNLIMSQPKDVRENIRNINALLQANPYTDTFLEITFYYSVDVTPEKELVVNMDFDGPFRTIFKAGISDLDRTLRIDTALEGTSSICWYCKQDTSRKPANCIINETVTKDGEKDSHFTDNICVMISRKSEIRSKLIEEFGNLFRKVLEQE